MEQARERKTSIVEEFLENTLIWSVTCLVESCTLRRHFLGSTCPNWDCSKSTYRGQLAIDFVYQQNTEVGGILQRGSVQMS